MKPGHGEVLIAEGDVELAEDELMLIEEFRILYAARSLRPKPVLTRRRDRRRRVGLRLGCEPVQLVGTVPLLCPGADPDECRRRNRGAGHRRLRRGDD